MGTASEVVATVGAVAGQGGWLALVLLLVWVMGRSKPGHDLAWLVGTDLRYRYLKRRGFSEEELHEWLRERTVSGSE